MITGAGSEPFHILQPGVIFREYKNNLLVKEGNGSFLQFAFNFLLQSFVLSGVAILSVFSILPPTGLFDCCRADFSIKICCFNCFSRAIVVKVQVDEELNLLTISKQSLPL